MARHTHSSRYLSIFEMSTVKYIYVSAQLTMGEREIRNCVGVPLRVNVSDKAFPSMKQLEESVIRASKRKNVIPMPPPITVTILSFSEVTLEQLSCLYPTLDCTKEDTFERITV